MHKTGLTGFERILGNINLIDSFYVSDVSLLGDLLLIRHFTLDIIDSVWEDLNVTLVPCEYNFAFLWKFIIPFVKRRLLGVKIRIVYLLRAESAHIFSDLFDLQVDLLHVLNCP